MYISIGPMFFHCVCIYRSVVPMVKYGEVCLRMACSSLCVTNSAVSSFIRAVSATARSVACSSVWMRVDISESRITIIVSNTVTMIKMILNQDSICL